MNRQETERVGLEARPPAGLGLVRVHTDLAVVGGRPPEVSPLQRHAIAVLRLHAVVEELGDELGEYGAVDEQRQLGVDVGGARVEVVASDDDRSVVGTK